MNRKFLILILSVFTQICVSQEEIFFNDINIDKKDIKVSKKLHGFEFGIDALRISPSLYYARNFGSIVSNINYFHENRIAQTLTLNKSIGFVNSFYNQRLLNNNLPGNENSSPYSKNSRYNYDFSISTKIELRWYFGHVRRYIEDKSTENNSGWFLSLPLYLSSNVIKYQAVEHNSSFEKKLNFIVAIGPTIGYRSSLSANWFLEASLGYTPINYRYNDTDLYGLLRSQLPNEILTFDSYRSELKIAYLIK